MSDLRPDEFKIEVETREEKDKRGQRKTTRRKISIDTEDIFVIGGVVIAILFVLGMAIGRIPVNELTVGVLGLSAVAAGAARIIKARKATKKSAAKPKKPGG